jgi:hypothetical protein
MTNAYRISDGKPNGSRSRGRPRRTFDDNIDKDLKEIGCEDVY